MLEIILAVHLLIALGLVGVVLLQRSEGGALGIGGGGGGGAGGLLSARGAGSALTRATAVLAACFFATSITLTILAARSTAPTSVFDNVNTGPNKAGDKKPGTVKLPTLPPSPPTDPTKPKVPTGQ